MKSKKVPNWICDVIEYTQRIDCADTRNYILDEIISGSFDTKELRDIRALLNYHNNINQRLIHID